MNGGGVGSGTVASCEAASRGVAAAQHGDDSQRPSSPPAAVPQLRLLACSAYSSSLRLVPCLPYLVTPTCCGEGGGRQGGAGGRETSMAGRQRRKQTLAPLNSPPLTAHLVATGLGGEGAEVVQRLGLVLRRWRAAGKTMSNNNERRRRRRAPPMAPPLPHAWCTPAAWPAVHATRRAASTPGAALAPPPSLPCCSGASGVAARSAKWALACCNVSAVVPDGVGVTGSRNGPVFQLPPLLVLLAPAVHAGPGVSSSSCAPRRHPSTAHCQEERQGAQFSAPPKNRPDRSVKTGVPAPPPSSSAGSPPSLPGARRRAQEDVGEQQRRLASLGPAR